MDDVYFSISVYDSGKRYLQYLDSPSADLCRDVLSTWYLRYLGWLHLYAYLPANTNLYWKDCVFSQVGNSGEQYKLVYDEY